MGRISIFTELLEKNGFIIPCLKNEPFITLASGEGGAAEARAAPE